MQSNSEKSKEARQQLWQELEELHHQADLGFLKVDLLKMYENSLLSESLNDPEERHHIFVSFRYLYNFLLKAEMRKNPEQTGVNLL